MKRRMVLSGVVAAMTAAVLAGCGLTPYQGTRYEAMFVTGDEAQLTSVVTLTEDEETGAVSVGFEVESAQLVVRAQPGAPDMTVESVELEYFWADGTEIPQGEGNARNHAPKLDLYVPGGYTCEVEGCFGDVTRLPAPGERVTSAPFAGMPFDVAQNLYFGRRSPDNAYAMATVSAVGASGARDLTFEVGPIVVVQEVVRE